MKPVIVVFEATTRLALTAARRRVRALTARAASAACRAGVARYGLCMRKALTARRIWLARFIALAADVIQLAWLPLFVGGAPEVFDLALDAAVAIALCSLCGFHPAFLPAVVAEALPAVDLVPSWTLAVLIATHKSRGAALPARTSHETPQR